MQVLTDTERDELIARTISHFTFNEETKLNEVILKLAASVSVIAIQEYEKMRAAQQ